ncbi:response regulator transcription factor [Ectothiorhodospiraceae bacterium WFHF3C12]|nr:response regulator transcription factor [Ectothiorhodospiraceae bacterium WFHF3C12]
MHTEQEPCVFIVDDEQDVRDAIAMLVSSVDLQAESFATARDFLDAYDGTRPGCLILDVRLPGMNGLEAQKVLRERGITLPVIFISGHGDIPMAVRAVREGALDFVEKPFRDDALLACVQRAVEIDRENRAQEGARQTIEEHLDTLTPREVEVLERLIDGKVNKIIARELDVSTRTVEIHRARVLHKMGADNVSQLVRMALSTDRYKDRLS